MCWLNIWCVFYVQLVMKNWVWVIAFYLFILILHSATGFLELGLFNFCLIEHNCSFATQRAHEKWNQGSFPYFVSEHRKSF